MGVREELTARVKLIQGVWEASPSAPGVPRVEVINLVAVLPSIPLGVMRRLRGRVNAAEFYGIPAGHLLMMESRSMRHPDDAIEIIVLLFYRDVPWNRLPWWPPDEWRETVDADGRSAFPAGDFEELLAALEPATDAGGGTWRDRPSML